MTTGRPRKVPTDARMRQIIPGCTSAEFSDMTGAALETARAHARRLGVRFKRVSSNRALPNDDVLVELMSVHTAREIRKKYRVSKQALHQHCTRLGVSPLPAPSSGTRKVPQDRQLIALIPTITSANFALFYKVSRCTGYLHAKRLGVQFRR